jgi:tRNA pseudouridine32 synthase/23S rRNA pseudouridine746 synthase
VNPPPLDIILQTPRFVVIDKPPGLLSVPGRGPHKHNSVATRLRAHLPAADGPLTVHRLDMETSGLILLALDPDAHRALSMQFEQRTVEKTYIGVVQGSPARDEGRIDLRQRLDVDNRPRQILDETHGKRAVTRYRVLARNEDHARVEFNPITGRTHQIRLAAAAPEPHGLACPLRGDSLYADTQDAPRLLLHATRLTFTDPDSDRRITAESDPPF